MITQYVWVALLLAAGFFGFRFMKQRQAAATAANDPPEDAAGKVTLSPKIPSSADAFSATEIIAARLKAVGMPDEEIAAVRRPILENISKEAKVL